MQKIVSLIEQLYESAKTTDKQYASELDKYANDINQLSERLTNTVANLRDIETKYHIIQKENDDLKYSVLNLKDEIANLKKVSIYTNLNKQIMEKDNYIAVLEKQLNIRQAREALIETKSNHSVEAPKEEPVAIIDKPADTEEEIEDEEADDAEEAEDEEADDAEEADDEDENEDIETEEEDENEIEYETVKIGKKYYYVSNEEPEMVYEVVKGTNDVGNQIGEYDRENNKIIK
jgi:chromosome segregation ATPase